MKNSNQPMQLYKSRGFGEYFGDTFSFLKLNGKHFFKNYFIITGVFLLILLVFGYLFTQFYRELFSSMLINTNSNAFEEYLNVNGSLVAVVLLLFLTIGLIAAIISYAYTPIYLKLYNEHSGKNFEIKHIVSVYKNTFGKLIVFLLAGILMGLILIIPIAIAGFLLVITIIGFVLLPFLVGLVMLLYTGTLIEFLEGKKGIFDCFGYTWKLISSKFWAAIASVGIFYLMSYLAQQIVTIIPYMLGMVSMFTTIDETQPDTAQVVDSMTLVMMLVFFLSFIVGIFLNNIVQLNQGVVFYSLKEENENINTKSDIDLIGSSE